MTSKATINGKDAQKRLVIDTGLLRRGRFVARAPIDLTGLSFTDSLPAGIDGAVGDEAAPALSRFCVRF